MTIEEAIRLLDPATTADTLADYEYYGGFRGKEAAICAINEACTIACDIMRKAIQAGTKK